MPGDDETVLARNQLTFECLSLLLEWGTNLKETALILGFPATTRTRQIRKHYEGLALPEDEHIRKRARMVIRLGDALRTTYPSSQQMRMLWMRNPNKRFAGESPLARMSQGDDEGLEAVLALLDCSYAWEITR